jgi:predicted metalloprotease with PDZ domain
MPVFAQTATEYVIRFPAPERHLVEIEARATVPATGQLELLMAVWTPGSYLVREFARHLETISAEGPDGAPLAVVKTAKNRWRIEAPAGRRVAIRYRLYAHELTVRNNFVDPSFALLNGAPTFLVPAGSDGPAPGDFTVRLELPAGWRQVATALPAAPELGPHAFRAADFDTLADSPIYAGNGTLREVVVDGVSHAVLDEGGDDFWNGERALAGVGRIAAAHRNLFGGAFPYSRYLFLNLLVEAGGGLEHKDSTVLMASRWDSGTREGHLDWLALASHEHFHAWNVKRLRPIELGPFDYEREVHTESLWIAEGLTSYYDELQVHRAGLMTRDEYLERLSDEIETFETTPGRRVQPLTQASFDAWIKFYRPDENSKNATVSYYTKGAMVGLLLDVEIRRATGGARSLDDVMRAAWTRFSGDRGFRAEEFRALVSEVADNDLSGFLTRALDTTEDLDFGPALAWYGLRFEAPDEDEPPAGWLGAETTDEDGRLVVEKVPTNTPASHAGLAAGDEILALDGYRVPPRSLEDRLEAFQPGQTTRLLVARRERLVELSVTFGEDPGERFNLEVDPAASDEAKAHLAAWLSGPTELPEAPPAKSQKSSAKSKKSTRRR